MTQVNLKSDVAAKQTFVEVVLREGFERANHIVVVILRRVGHRATQKVTATKLTKLGYLGKKP